MGLRSGKAEAGELMRLLRHGIFWWRWKMTVYSVGIVFLNLGEDSFWERRRVMPLFGGKYFRMQTNPKFTIQNTTYFNHKNLDQLAIPWLLVVVREYNFVTNINSNWNYFIINNLIFSPFWLYKKLFSSILLLVLSLIFKSYSPL